MDGALSGGDIVDARSFLVLALHFIGAKSMRRYMYSHSNPSEGAGKLVMTSLNIPKREPFCLDFYYKFSSERSGAKFFIYSLSSDNLTVLWSSDIPYHVPEDEWTWAAIRMPPGKYDLTFELRSYDYHWLDKTAMFALDDVTIASCQILKGMGSSLVKNSVPTRPLPSYRTRFRCNFDQGDLCGATVEELCAYQWELQPMTSYPYQMPHTATPPGNFLHFNGTTSVHLLTRRPIASLSLPDIWAYHHVCLHFRFLMNTSREVELEAWISGNLSPNSKKQLWVHEGSNGAKWRNVLVALPYTDFKIYLRARKESLDDYAAIGIDNIQIDSCQKLDAIDREVEVYEPGPPGNGISVEESQAPDFESKKGNLAPNDGRYSTHSVPAEISGNGANKHNSDKEDSSAILHKYNGGQPCNCNCTPVCAQSPHAQCSRGIQTIPTFPTFLSTVVLVVYVALSSGL